MTTCSYCDKPADYEGTHRFADGSLDSDFYCEAHKDRAPGSVIKMEETA